MKAAAVFDLDGTILRGTSAERRLVPFLWRRGMLGWSQVTRALAQAAALPLVGATAALRRNKRYLAGVKVDALDAVMPLFVSQLLEDFTRPDVTARMEALRGRGFTLLLVTGAPDFIAQAVGSALRMDSAVGTVLEVHQGRYTGGLAGPHLFGLEKPRAVARLARLHDLDLEGSLGFADHASDTAFLSCFGHPVAVAPDPGLLRHASRMGWEVVEAVPSP